MTETQRVPLGLKFGYAVSELGVNTFVVLASLVLFVYMISFLGVPPGIAGILFAVTKIWDVITDPLIGRWSDSYQSRYGRRRPFMFAGAFLMAGAVALMFLAPFSGSDGWVLPATYFMVMLILAYTGLTLIGVPYGAMTAEMTQDYEERSRLTSYRMTFASIGTLIAFVALPLVVAAFSGNGIADLGGYRVAGLLLFPILALPTLITVWTTGSARQSEVPPKSYSLAEQAQIVFSSRPFLLLAGTYLIQVAMITQVVASLLYIIFYIVGVDAENAGVVQGNMGGILIVAAVLSFPVWLLLLRRMDKRSLYMIGTLGFGLVTCLMFFMGKGDLTFMYINLALLGIFYGAYNLFPWSMLPDIISHEQAKRDGSLEGLFNGWWTAFQKLGIALGPAFIGLFLQAAGFQEGSRDNPLPEQTEAAINMLHLMISIVPGLIFLSTLALLAAYNLTRQDQDAIAY